MANEMSAGQAAALLEEFHAPTPKPETSKERFKRLSKVLAEKEHSLPRKIVESELYDWHPSARFLLTQLVVLAMDEDSDYPEEAPEAYKKDKSGWCWMSQARLALRVGMSESQVQRLLKQFLNDKVIEYRYWHDDHKAMHAEYKVKEDVIDAYQRPSQHYDVVRPSRYKKSRKGTAAKQPRDKGKFARIVEEDGD
jgi:hypothetical protein